MSGTAMPGCDCDGGENYLVAREDFSVSTSSTATSTTDASKSWSNGTSTSLTTDESSSTCTASSRQVKDRGYAWVILAASFLCQVIGVGSALSAGVFTPILLSSFPVNREVVAGVGSLHAGLVFFAGPISGVLADRFGYRVIIIWGAVLSSLGVGLSACATQIWMLYISYGILGGVGICFTYIPAVTLLVNYFERWKYVAFSVSATGVGIGTLVVPQYIRWLQDEYGWRGAYILTSAMLLQLTVCGMLMRDPPGSRHARNQHNSIKLFIKHHVSVLTNWRFNLFLLNNFLFNFGSLIVFVFISDYAELRGMTREQGTYLISIVGISNAVGRGLSSVFAICECKRTYIYVASCTLSGVSVCFISVQVACPQPCFLAASVCCSLYGALFGIQLGNHAILTHSLTGPQQLNSAFGLAMLLNGAGAISGPPVAGLLYQATGDFKMAYYVAGGTILLAGVVLLPVLVYPDVQSTHQSCDNLPTGDGGMSGVGVDIIMASIPNLHKAAGLTVGQACPPHSAGDVRVSSTPRLNFRQRYASYHALSPTKSTEHDP